MSYPFKKYLDNFRKKISALKEKSHDIQTARLDKKLVSRVRDIHIPPIKKLKYLHKVLSHKERRTIQLLMVVIILCLTLAGSIYYFRNFEVVPISGGEYVEGLIGSPEFINPLLAQTNDVDYDISRLVFSGLMRFDNNLELQPDLTEKYEISEDKKVYTFTLRKDVAWHDGEIFDADDVVFTYQSIQDPEFKSPLYVSLKGIRVEKTSPFQVVFTLNESYPSFLEILSTGILPEHIWTGIPPINANLTEYNIKPVGTGSWKFKSLSKDRLGNIKSYTLIPHEIYYGRKPFLEKITFKFFPDFQSGVEALNNKSVEGLSFLPKGLENEIRNKNVSFYSFYLPQYTALFFNQKNNEALKNKNVRRALVLSIDKTKILTEALRLKGEIIDSPILPGFLGHNPDIEKMPFDPIKAAEELKSAGWEKITKEEFVELVKEKEEKSKKDNAEKSSASKIDDILEKQTPGTSTDGQLPAHETDSIAKPPEETLQDFYLKKDGEIFEITLTTVDLPENTKAAELIKEFWSALYIKVDLKTVSDVKITREVIKPRDYEVLLFGVIVGADADPYPFWHSSQVQDPGLNLANYANRKVDALLEEARTTADEEKRVALYKEFQSIISSEIPAIFLYNPTYTYVSHKKIKGLDTERVIAPSDRFNGLSGWYVKTGRKSKP